MVGFILDEGEIYWLSMGILVAALSIIAASIVFGRILYQEVTKKFLDYLKMFEDPTNYLTHLENFWNEQMNSGLLMGKLRLQHLL